MRREEVIGTARLVLGDSREWLEGLARPEVAIVADPPYGMKLNTDSTRFSGGGEAQRQKRGRSGRADRGAVVGDDGPFDPSPFLDFAQVILWGANHFAARLPVGTTLVWIKRLDAAFGSFLSDAEVAWQRGGHGVYCHRDLSNNAIARTRVHPTQKPVGLMKWCVARTSAPVVCDPYMGSGTTGVACVELGRPFFGIEIDQQHFDNACRRIEEAHRRRSADG